MKLIFCMDDLLYEIYEMDGSHHWCGLGLGPTEGLDGYGGMMLWGGSHPNGKLGKASYR